MHEDSANDNFLQGNGASHTPPRHPVHVGLFQSWRSPSSGTESNRYQPVGVLAREQKRSEADAAASRRRGIDYRKT